MANLKSPPDKKLLSVFNKTPYRPDNNVGLLGMPQDFFLDTNNTISSSIFGERFHISRTSRQGQAKFFETKFKIVKGSCPAYTGKLNAVPAYLSIPSIRRYLCKQALSYSYDKLPKAHLTFPVSSSPEFKLISDYLPTWRERLPIIIAELSETPCDPTTLYGLVNDDRIFSILIRDFSTTIISNKLDGNDERCANTLWLTQIDPALNDANQQRALIEKIVEQYPSQKLRFNFLLTGKEDVLEEDGIDVIDESSEGISEELSFQELTTSIETAIQTIKEGATEANVLHLNELSEQLLECFRTQTESHQHELFKQFSDEISLWSSTMVSVVHDDIEQAGADLIGQVSDVSNAWQNRLENVIQSHQSTKTITEKLPSWVEAAKKQLGLCVSSMDQLVLIDAAIDQLPEIEDPAKRRKSRVELEQKRMLVRQALDDQGDDLFQQKFLPPPIERDSDKPDRDAIASLATALHSSLTELSRYYQSLRKPASEVTQATSLSVSAGKEDEDHQQPESTTLEDCQPNQCSESDDGTQINSDDSPVLNKPFIEDLATTSDTNITVSEPPLESSGGDVSPAHLDWWHLYPKDLAVAQTNAIRNEGLLHSELVNSVAASLIAQKALPYAYWELAFAPVQDGLIPKSLIKTAYYGLNVWGESNDSTSDIGRRLSQISSPDIFDGLPRLSQKIGHWLVVAASLQATLFAGFSAPVAPIILQRNLHLFESRLREVLSSIVQFAQRGNTFTLSDFQQQGTSNQERIKEIQSDLQEWAQIIRDSQRGWFGLRRALKSCLDGSSGVFRPIEESIRLDKQSELTTVESFVSTYSNESAVVQLMQTSIQNNWTGPSTPQVEGQTVRTQFLRSTEELVAIAQRWVAYRRHISGDAIQREQLASRLHGLINKRVDELKPKIDHIDGYGADAASALEHAILINLLDAFNKVKGTVWNARRAKAFFHWPKERLVASGAISDDLKLEGIVSPLITPIDQEQEFFESIRDGRAHHAQLFLDSVPDKDGAENALHMLRTKQKHECKNAINGIDVILSGAGLTALVDEEELEENRSALEDIRQRFDEADRYDDLNVFMVSLAAIREKIERRTSSLVEDIQTRYSEIVGRLHSKGVVIPKTFTDIYQQAIHELNIPILEELVQQLNEAVDTGTPLPEPSSLRNTLLEEFISREKSLLTQLGTMKDPRALRRQLKTDDFIAQLGISSPADKTAEAAESLLGLANTRVKNISNELYSQIISLLEFLGFSPQRIDYTRAMAESLNLAREESLQSFSLVMDPTYAGMPFPDFGRNTQRMTIVIATTSVKPETIEQHLRHRNDPSDNVMLLADVLKLSQRNEIAAYCKLRKQRWLILDIPLLVFFGSVRARGSKPVNTFLQLLSPWTYFNPYREEYQGPPHPEMRFGRREEIDRLMRPNSDAAIVFGGRQLGKSTILKEVADKFNKPEERQYALDERADGFTNDSHFAPDTPDFHTSVMTKAWRRIGEFLVSQNLLNSNEIVAKGAEEIQASIRALMNRDEKLRILIILDEADKLIEVDSVRDFDFFRQVRDLVYATNNRFKLIIAGLHNVNRFRDMPNFPLAQLGGAIQIGMMPIGDALNLIRIPITAAGYRFKSEMTINRILVNTNRHPGLLQLIGGQLLQRMGNKPNVFVGQGIITDQDVDEIFEDQRVREQIVDRFENTIILDSRYALIVYSLIIADLSRSRFTAAQVRSVAKEWSPTIAKMGVSQVEALLRELIGLGVLTEEGHFSPAQFRLRNANVVKLLGGEAEIEDRLLRQSADDGIKPNPLLRHRIEQQGRQASPLSLSEEKQLFFDSPASAPTDYLRSIAAISNDDKHHHATTLLLAGSRALGIVAIKTAVETLELGARPNEPERHYRVREPSVTDLDSLENFSKWVAKLTTFSENNSILGLIKITGEHSILDSLELITVAERLCAENASNKNPLRFLFTLNPLSLWQWMQQIESKNIRNSESLATLSRWSKTALLRLLDIKELPNNENELNWLHNLTNGWHCLLEPLIEMKISNQSIREIRPDRLLGRNHFSKKTASKFLDDVGLSKTLFPWAIPLIKQIHSTVGETGFERDMFFLIVDESGLFEASPAPWLLDWMVRLSIVSATQKNLFALDPIVLNAVLNHG